LRLASTVELRPYAYDFVGWFDELERPRSEAPQARQTVVLFWRDPADRSCVLEVGSPELRVLRAVKAGRRISQDQLPIAARLRALGAVLPRETVRSQGAPSPRRSSDAA
jgi:hypothetical protein